MPGLDDPGYVGDESGSGQPVNGVFGNRTQTAGTEILRVISPRENARAKIASWRYTAAATAHTLTFMTAQDVAAAAMDVAATATAITTDTPLTGLDGGIVAANDFIITQLENGGWVVAKVSSVSGLTITVAAQFSATLKVLKDARVFLMGAIADHTDRQFAIPANTTVEFKGKDLRVCACTAAMDNEPILAHSANATDAGALNWMAYVYGDA